MKQNSFFKQVTYTQGLYPTFKADQIKNPNKLYAVPAFGLLIKLIMLIPVMVEVLALGIAVLALTILINPFVVLITGKYWKTAYDVSLGFLRLGARSSSFLYGLTDKYPGFDWQSNIEIKLDLAQNDNPNKLFAFPVLGGVVRYVFLIPYFIFSGIINQAATIGIFLLAWAVVLFKGEYPEGIFELARDSIRVSSSSAAYALGISDRYPSFYLNMDHDKIKIILIVLAIILSGWKYSQPANNTPKPQPFPSGYQYPQATPYLPGY